MSLVIPESTRRQIFAEVFRLAEETSYIECSRIQNSQFMARLVADPKIGGKLAEYLGHERVRTYIKDSILKRYAKERNKPKTCLTSCARRLLGANADSCDSGVREISVHCCDGVYLVMTAIQFSKWEVGLRRLLLYIAGRRRIEIATPKLAVLLHGFRSNLQEREMVERALALANVITVWDV